MSASDDMDDKSTIESLEDTIDNNNAIDYIIQKVSETVISEGTIDFNNLRSLTQIASIRHNHEVICEVIVMSFIKYLGLKKTFAIEIKENANSYRIFNAFNLNDDRTNGMFVEIIATLAPEALSAVACIISDISTKLARENQTRYTNDRLSRIQETINQRIAKGEVSENSIESRYDKIRQAREEKAKAKHEKDSKKQKVRKNSFNYGMSDFLLGNSYKGNIKTIEGSKRKSHKHKTSSSSDKSHELQLGINRINLGGYNNKSKGDETASETAERLAKLRKKEKSAIPDTDKSVSHADVKEAIKGRVVKEDEVISESSL